MQAERILHGCEKLLSRALLLFVCSSVFCFPLANAGETAKKANPTTKAKLETLKSSIESAYKDQDFARAVPVFSEMIGLMKKEYGANDASVGQALHNYAYLLSSLHKEKEASDTAVEASKIQLANGTDTALGNPTVGKFSYRCPNGYAIRRHDRDGDPNLDNCNYDFLDTPVSSGQQYTLNIRIWEMQPSFTNSYGAKNIESYLSSCFAEGEVKTRFPAIVINGIKFDRALALLPSRGDYSGKRKDYVLIYFAKVGGTDIVIRCESGEHGFTVTRALLEPSFMSFKKVN